MSDNVVFYGASNSTQRLDVIGVIDNVIIGKEQYDDRKKEQLLYISELYIKSYKEEFGSEPPNVLNSSYALNNISYLQNEVQETGDLFRILTPFSSEHDTEVQFSQFIASNRAIFSNDFHLEPLGLPCYDKTMGKSAILELLAIDCSNLNDEIISYKQDYPIRTEYEFHDNNNIKTETIIMKNISPDKGQNELYVGSKFLYNENGKLDKYINYNEYGQVILETFFNKNESILETHVYSPKMLCLDKLFYQDGLIKKNEHYQINNDGSFQLDSMKYYDENMKLTHETILLDNDKRLERSYFQNGQEGQFDYYYNSNNILTKEKHNFNNHIIEKHYANNNGNLLEDYHYYRDDTPTNYSFEKNTYNADGELQYRISKYSDFSKGLKTLTSKYENGLLSKEILEQHYLKTKTKTITNYDEKGYLKELYSYTNDLLTKQVTFHPSSQIPKYEKYCYDNGEPYLEAFYNKDSKLHNENGYARKVWYRNGNPKIEVYFINGEYREDVTYPHKEWTENGEFLHDVNKEKTFRTLESSLPTRVIEDVSEAPTPMYTEVDKGMLFSSEPSPLWLIEFDNNERIPYTLFVPHFKNLTKKSLHIYLEEQHEIIKDYYNKRPELASSLQEFGVNLQNDLHKTLQISDEDLLNNLNISSNKSVGQKL